MATHNEADASDDDDYNVNDDIASVCCYSHADRHWW